MKRLIVLAFVLFPLNSAVAADLSKVVAIRNAPPLESLGYVLIQGNYQTEVTNYGVNKRTGLLAEQILPFVGTRFFNLRGGTRSVESITIERNGDTTLKDVDYGVYWKGRFSSPIPLSDRGMLGDQKVRGLLFKKSSVYAVGGNGKIISGCIDVHEGTLCVSKLVP